MKTVFDPATLDDTIRRIARLTPDHMPAWGRMSVGEMVCHLGDYLRMATGEVGAAPVGNAVTAALARWIVFGLRVGFPKNARTLPELRRTPPDTLARDVAELLTLLRAFAARRDRTDWPRNPLFGRISGQQWADVVYRHTDHHLRQFRV